jgi:uncharacterized protein (TIGR03067 family)
MDAFVRFCCPGCGRKIKAKQGDVQYTVYCKCGFELVIPGREPVESPEELPRPRARPRKWGWFARTFFFLVGVGLAALLAIICPPGPGDREDLQGLWSVFALESKGRQLPARALLTSEPPLPTLIFQGERMSYWRPGEEPSVFTYELDEKTAPRSIDITRLSGSRKGEIWHGVYEVDGDRLRIRFATANGKPRPTELKTDRHSEEPLFCYRRLPARQSRWSLRNASLQSLEALTGKTTYQIDIRGKGAPDWSLTALPGQTQVALRFELMALDPDPFAIERILSDSMGAFIQDAVDRAPEDKDKNLLRSLKQSGKQYAFLDVSPVDLIRSATEVREVARWMMVPARVHIFDVDVGGSFRSQAQMEGGSESWPLSCRWSSREGEIAPDFQALVEVGRPVTVEILYSLQKGWREQAYLLRYGESEAIPVEVMAGK